MRFALIVSAVVMALTAVTSAVLIHETRPLEAAPDGLVTVCHQTGSGANTMDVSESSLQTHLDHGDSLGACDGDPTPTPTQSPTATPTEPPTPTPTPTESPSPTPSPTASATPSSTTTPSPTVVPTPDPAPSPTPPPASPVQTSTPAPTSTPTPAPAPTPEPTAIPTAVAAAATVPTPPPTQPAPTAPPPHSGGTLPASAVIPNPGPLGPPAAVGAANVPAPPTSTATPVPTPTGTPVRTPTATPTVRATSTPPAITSSVPGAVSTPELTRTNGARSVFVQDFPSFADLSASPAVILTNVVLSLLALMLILLASSVFNSTLEEKGSALADLLGRLVAPFGLSLAFLRGNDNEDVDRPISLIRLGLILLTVGTIYSALDPEFGLNTTTAALVISLALGLGMITLVYEGAQALLASKAAGVRSSVQLQPLGIVIAAASVLVTRLTDVHPGIVLGVIAGAAVGSHDARLQGRLVAAAMVGIIGISLLALLAVGPFQSLSDGHAAEWWAVIPETVAVTLFVGGIEGVLFSMLPLRFMEGRRVWDWNRAAWALLATAATFLFFHVVLNRTDAYTSVVEETGVQALFAICVAALLLASTFWLACRHWLPGETAAPSGP